MAFHDRGTRHPLSPIAPHLPDPRDQLLDPPRAPGSGGTRVNRGPVALFLPTLTGGGAQRIAINLAQGFVDSGVSTHMVAVNAVGELAGKVPPGVRLIDLQRSRVILG